MVDFPKKYFFQLLLLLYKNSTIVTAVSIPETRYLRYYLKMNHKTRKKKKVSKMRVKIISLLKLISFLALIIFLLENMTDLNQILVS